MIIHGDMLVVLPTLAADSLDAAVTDPPYELGFMGKHWDASGIAFEASTWAALARVLKPGAHLCAFGGTRTFHRIACAIEDGGFEIRDCLSWLYGQGFPKSLDVSKAIDRAAGAERDTVGEQRRNRSSGNTVYDKRPSRPTGLYANETFPVTAPATAEAKTWAGWGTALKPSWEPIILARKPLSGTVAANVMEHGTGAINVDACRLEADEGARVKIRSSKSVFVIMNDDGWQARPVLYDGSKGRWPSNVVLDEDAAAMLDAQSGELSKCGGPKTTEHSAGMFGIGAPGRVYPDSGGASRFFYVAKVSRSERDLGCDGFPSRSGGEATDREDGSAGTQSPRAGAGRTGGSKNIHPTVKPVDLLRWLVRLITPPGGTVLDPFMGSGSTGMACRAEQRAFVGIEREAEYVEIARQRVEAVAPLFGEVEP